MSECKLTIGYISIKTNSPEAMQQALGMMGQIIEAAIPLPAIEPPKRKRKRKAITGEAVTIKEPKAESAAQR